MDLPKRTVHYTDEERLKVELAPKMEEKGRTKMTNWFINHGLVRTPHQAQIAMLVLFILCVIGSAYFYSLSRADTKIVPREAYERNIPYQR